MRTPMVVNPPRHAAPRWAVALAVAVCLVGEAHTARAGDGCAADPPPEGLVQRCHGRVFWFPSGMSDRLRRSYFEVTLVEWMRTCVISERAPGLVFEARDSVDRVFELIKDLPDLRPVRIVPDYAPLPFTQRGRTCYGVKGVSFRVAEASGTVDANGPIDISATPASDLVKEAAAAGRKALQDPSVRGSMALSRFLGVLEQLERYGNDFDDTWYNVQPWSTGDPMDSGACYKDYSPSRGNLCRASDDALKACERHLTQQVVEAYSYDKDSPARFAEVLDTIAHDIQRSVDHLAAMQGQDTAGAVACPSIKDAFMPRIAALARKHSVYLAGGY